MWELPLSSPLFSAGMEKKPKTEDAFLLRVGCPAVPYSDRGIFLMGFRDPSPSPPFANKGAELGNYVVAKCPELTVGRVGVKTKASVLVPQCSFPLEFNSFSVNALCVSAALLF